MRVSVERTDKAFSEEARSGRYKAYLDGKEVVLALTADEEKGYIKRYKLDESGNVLLNESGVPIKEEVTGNVEIKDLGSELESLPKK